MAIFIVFDCKSVMIVIITRVHFCETVLLKCILVHHPFGTFEASICCSATVIGFLRRVLVIGINFVCEMFQISVLMPFNK